MLFKAAALAALLCAAGWRDLDRPVPAEAAAIESVAILAGPGHQADALRTLEKWSGEGSAVATRELGLVYMKLPDKAPLAPAAFRRAADRGDAVAAFMLGEAARLGTFQSRDLKAARQWYGFAALKGHAEAALMLGRMSVNGEGGPADTASAVRWLTRSAQLGNAQAMFLLFEHYAEAPGGSRDWEQARRWLDESADRHYPPAIHALALALETGQFGFRQDSRQAALLMKEAGEESRNRWNAR